MKIVALVPSGSCAAETEDDGAFWGEIFGSPARFLIFFLLFFGGVFYSVLFFLNKPWHQAPVAFQFFFNPLVKCSGEETKRIARNVALT